MGSCLRNSEIKVFLKCQDCGTFITSPSFPVIKKHFDKCQQQIPHSNLTDQETTQPGNDDLDLECDFIDDKTETVTFSQPFVALKRLSTFVPNGVPNQLPVSDRAPRKSRLKALEKLSKITKLEKQNFNVSDAEEDWPLEVEENSDDEFTEDENATVKNYARHLNNKRRQRKAKSSCVYDNPRCPIKCPDCTARFTTEDLLNRHKQYVHQNKHGDVCTCCICGRMFHYRLSFQAHLKYHENAEGVEEAFNLWNKWPEPKGKRKRVVFNCKYCLMPHTNNHDFLSHMSADHSDKGRNYNFPCPYSCSSHFDSIKQLIEHFKDNHTVGYYGNVMKWKEKIPNITREPNKKCDEDECGNSTESYCVIARRKRCPSVNGKPEETYRCPFPQCESSCNLLITLKGHFILHLQNNPYVCTFAECTFKADRPSGLKRHIQLHLDRIKDVGDSDKSDKLNKLLQSIQQVDLCSVIKSDPVFIKACEDSPGFGKLILGHQYFGDNETKVKKKRGVKCPNCPTVFDGRHGYNQHKKTCKGGVKLQKGSHVLIGCPVCGKSFENSKVLEHHLNESHNSDEVFKCEEPGCGKYFANEAIRKGHFDAHHIDVPYRCQKCRQGFKTEVGFRQHMKRHEVNPHFRDRKLSVACQECGTVVFSPANLRRHMKLKHGITVVAPVRTKKMYYVKKQKKIKDNTKSTKQEQVKSAMSSERRSGRRVDKKVLNQIKSEDVMLQGDEVCVQIKVEPELIIGADLNDMDVDIERWDQVIKHETE